MHEGGRAYSELQLKRGEKNSVNKSVYCKICLRYTSGFDTQEILTHGLIWCEILFIA